MIKQIHTLIIISLLVNPLKADNGHEYGALCAAGGAAAVAFAWGCFSLFSKDNVSPERALSDLRNEIDAMKLKYEPIAQGAIARNGDEFIEKIASVLKSNNSNPESYVEQMERDLSTLRKKISLVQERTSDKEIIAIQRDKLEKSLQEVEPLVKRFEEIATFIKLNSPFVKLSCELIEENERSNRYNRIMNGASNFPLVSALDQIEADAHKVASTILASKMVCNNNGCSDFQYSLINRAENLRRWLDTEVSRIRASESLIKQKEEKKWIENETAKNKEKAEKERKERELVTKQLIAQQNKQEELRQNDVRQKLTKKILKEGRYFDPERERFKNEINKLEKEIALQQVKCDNLRTELENSKDSSKYQLRENKELKKLVAKLQAELALKISIVEKMKKELNEVEKKLANSPFSPDDEDNGPWLKMIKAMVKSIKENKK